MKLKILHLYPKEMNLYGDHGNVLTLVKRCEWRGIKTEVIEHEPGDPIPDDIDIIFGGGGQDSNQDKIEDDLRKIGPKLKKLVEADVPTLVVCGLYQLFGDYFETAEGKIIHGIDILDIATKAGPTRLIGNVIISTPEFGEIVGYENHSGLTTLGKNVTAFGTVVKGYGNNSEDFTEGAKYKNCIGTYLHGPILPKNPRLADYFIKKALEKRGNTNKLERLNDSIEHRAHKVASSRPQ
ncbi:glutamine amidotransferase [Candidatus Saccharibacteria bacterium]|nr:glutamine amidotransferase [Candidatus Saccharibacteria bacterium]MBR3378068.1 glutamine amidotransferase [Candidatus Saccharibacteria bacterium]